VAGSVAGQRPLAERWLDGQRGLQSQGETMAAAHLRALSTMLEGRPERPQR
jgi:hypothetical protein